MCLYGSKLDVVKDLRYPNTWRVYRWIDDSWNIGMPPDQSWTIPRLELIFPAILPGNALKFCSASSIVEHYAICAGKNPRGELMIIDRYPSNAKSFNHTGGGLRTVKLSDLVDTPNLLQLIIYQCHIGVLDHFCRASALHKAFTHDLPKGWRPLDDNCEHFVRYCCDGSVFNKISSQAIMVIYDAATIILFLACFAFGTLFRIGIAETICLSSFCSSLTYLSYEKILQRILFIYNKREEKAFLKQWIDKLENLKNLDVEKLIKQNNRGDDNVEKSIAQAEKDTVDMFYFTSQNGQYMCRHNPEIQISRVKDNAAKAAQKYLQLKYDDLAGLCKHTESSIDYFKIFDRLTYFFIDLKVFQMTVFTYDPSPIDWKLLKMMSRTAILWIVCMFKLDDGIDRELKKLGVEPWLNAGVEPWWTEDHLSYGEDMCSELALTLSKSFPSQKCDRSSTRTKKLFDYLDLYWNRLRDVSKIDAPLKTKNIFDKSFTLRLLIEISEIDGD